MCNYTCAECGQAFAPKRKDKAVFCSPACRNEANVRRRDRGALVYDLLVHHRFNRADAQKRGVRSKVDRMISNWIAEDRAAGRRAMRPLQDCIEAAVSATSQYL